jgi:hypothetical protein
MLQDEGLIDKYPGVDIRQQDTSSFKLTQPFLIERITKFLGIDNGKANEKLTPVGKPLLNIDLDGIPQKYEWEYQGAVGMLTWGVTFLADTKCSKSMLNLCFTMPATYIFTKFVPNKFKEKTHKMWSPGG